MRAEEMKAIPSFGRSQAWAACQQRPLHCSASLSLRKSREKFKPRHRQVTLLINGLSILSSLPFFSVAASKSLNASENSGDFRNGFPQSSGISREGPCEGLSSINQRPVLHLLTSHLCLEKLTSALPARLSSWKRAPGLCTRLQFLRPHSPTGVR